MSEHEAARGLLLGLLLTVAAASCGGSSSETPWPVEPVDTEPAPVGEARPGQDAPERTPAIGRSPDGEEDPEQAEPEADPD